MLTHKSIPLSEPELLAIAEFLGHKGRVVLERVIKGQIALAVHLSSDIDLQSPLNVLADGPQAATSRNLSIDAARLKVFLMVLEHLSLPETVFEYSKFEVE
jgi:hypothetical protein